MSIQQIMWTALPNGLTATGNRLRLSVLVSPRLVTDNGVTGTLKQFKDFLDWPAKVPHLEFTVEFQGGPSIKATPVIDPANPFDSAAWTALFPADTFVRSYAFEDKSGLLVRSFPVKKVLSFLKAEYQRVAVTSPAQKPTLAQLGFGRGGAHGALLQIALNPDVEDQLEKEIQGALNKNKAVPANLQLSPSADFLQVRIMHEFLSKRDPKGKPLPLPKQKLPEVDFHKGVAAMAQYPKLMRALGLAIDLEVPLQGVPPASSVRVTPKLKGPAPMTPWTAYRIDKAAKRFLPAPNPNSDVSNGMLLLSGPDQYEVVEMDIDGAARKVQDFASNLARIAFGGTRISIDTPQNYGLPSLRSAGFSATRVDRALRLVNTFQAAHTNNNAIIANPQSSAVVFHAEDVTRGYRIDVWSSLSNQWHSLCRRDGTYKFLNSGATRHINDDEGYVTVATSQSADGSSSDLRLPESLFRWAGWSLCAPRAGNTIGSKSSPQPPANPATTQIKLETSFKAHKKSLPRLRFLATYQFRARAVDLAGNSVPFDAALDDIYNLPPHPIPYLRYEPVAAPAVILRAPQTADTTPGESLERIVIRSNFDTHIASVSERHIAPPKISEDLAEAHGMLDTPAGPPDKALYAMLVDKDGSFNFDPKHPDQPVPHPEAQITLPYLPDPLAPGAAFRTLPGTSNGSVWKTPFAGDWPDALPFRFVLDEGPAAPAFTEDATERVLRVHLPKAEVATVALSSYLTDDDTTRPPRMLSTMKIWSWIQEANPPDLSDLQALSLDGGHWMLTPPRLLTLVHAVQQPLIEPQFQDLAAKKVIGQTFATLTDEFPIHGKSTIKIDIEGKWQEPVDDLSDETQPQILNGKACAFEVPVNPDDVVVALSADPVKKVVNKHEFHDTRHRNVTYTAVATTRFREYFPDSLTADPDNITRKSQPVTLSILNSARPAAPRPLYVVPTFGWEPKAEGSWYVSKRSAGGLRVYLDRPWFSSGEGELLGVVLWGCAPPPHAVFDNFQVPDFLKGCVTQWGMDPIWSTSPPPSQAVPLPEHFRKAVHIGTELSLDEVLDRPYIPFSVAGHEVNYNPERKLWYCDIEIDPGISYFPFIRLALARYQPDSVADAHLSRVVLADFAQLLPDRAASITFDAMDATVLQVAVTGLTHQGPGLAFMTATVQTQPLDGGGDLAWVPVYETRLQPYKSTGAETLWTAQITLPAPRGSRPFRLVIEEFESFLTNTPGGVHQKRLVYADVLTL